MKQQKTIVWITTHFYGFHRWKDAPEATNFLRDWHRHKFNVKIGVSVGGLNREVEFFDLKKQVNSFLTHYEGKQFEESCEMIASSLLVAFDAEFVTVDEDGENGATVLRIEPTIQSITSEVKTKCFIGTEAEGPNRGKKVLFVPGSIKAKDFRKVWDDLKDKPDRIYYGAGNDHNYKPKTFAEILDVVEWNCVDLEVDSINRDEYGSDISANGFNVISLDPNDKDATFLKVVERDRVVWINNKDKSVRYETMLNDPLFAQDKEIE